MSESCEIYGSLAEISKAKRAGNRASSQAILADAGIDFTSNNEGVHLVIVDHGNTFDFWPGTGKWRQRGGEYYRGVHRLMRAIERARPINNKGADHG